MVYLHARYYDPATGQFLSPDTLVPEPADVLSYNRYMYGYGNPLKYTDPSGHDPLDSAWQEEFYRIHGRTPGSIDMALRLFSIAFPSEWNEGLFYNVGGSSPNVDAVSAVFQNSSTRDWSGFGAALDSMSGWYSESETAAFVQDVAFLFAGTRGRYQAPTKDNAGPYWMNGGFAGNLHVYLGQGGLPERYFVRPDGTFDPDHNVHHWAWTFALGYNIGSSLASWVNQRREQGADQTVNGVIDASDVAIGTAGATMGGDLWWNRDQLHNLSEALYATLDWRP